MKQPREDITGTLLTDDLLSLEESAVAHRDALINMARLLWNAVLVGEPAPVVKEMLARIRSPRPGDLVVEHSVLYRRDPDTRMKGLGILIETRHEWATTDDEWAARLADPEELGLLEDEDRSTDEAWYVQYGPNPEDVCRWVDCEFFALPLDWRSRL